MNEISVYQGRPFVNIDGRYRKAQDSDELDGVETRPATKDERIAWEIPDGDYFFRSEVWRKGSSRPFVGWGRVRKSETLNGKGFKPIETNPQRMAEKRAEAQALRKAFNIPLPSIEDVGMRDDGKIIDTSTGEVIETTATVIEEQSTTEAPPTPEPKPASQPVQATLPGQQQAETTPSGEPICQIHKQPMFKKGAMKNYAHRDQLSNFEWCDGKAKA